jgi:hypothetical protein
VILPSHNKAYAENSSTQLVTSSVINESAGLLGAIQSMGNSSEPNVNISYPVTESVEFTNYLLEESHNIKEIVDHFEVAYESAYLSKDKKTMLLTEKPDIYGSKQTFAVSLESYLNDEVSAMLGKW